MIVKVIKKGNMEKEEIVLKLLNILAKKLNITLNYGDYKHNRLIFRGICNQLPPTKFNNEFYDLQDKLLSIERIEKGIVDVSDLLYKNNVAHSNGDITNLKADVIVNAANDEYLGCFVPCHNCIDNIIMSCAGFQMRNELLELKRQKDYDKQNVKVTRGYNLPCKYVFHIAGPIIYDNVSGKQKNDLKNCYLYCLDKAKEIVNKTVLFDENVDDIIKKL